MTRLILEFLRRERMHLALISILLGMLAWQKWGMNTKLVLSPGQPGLRLVHKDDHSDKGNSVCSVETTPDAWLVHYDIRPGVSWAFCGMNISRTDSSGFDLSGFDTAIIELPRFTGTNKSIQMTLKTMDTAIFKADDNVSLKYQTMEFFPPKDSVSTNSLPLESFSIPSWWVSRYRVPSLHLDRNRTDVREVEFLTSSGLAVIGTGTIAIRKIEFRGKCIRQETLLRIIFGISLGYVFLLMGINLYRSVRTERILRQREKRLEELASKDPLTGALNRRGLDEALASLKLRGLQRRNPVLGVIMLDLDHFKQINDTYGHDRGDAVLLKTSQILREFLREGNLLSRWGGEEFLVLVPGIPKDRIRQMAEKIRSKIEQSIHCEHSPVTASLGFSHGALEDFQHLVKLADLALYRAKDGGRNQVVDGTNPGT